MSPARDITAPAHAAPALPNHAPALPSHAPAFPNHAPAFPNHVMARIDRAITLNIVLMRMARSSRAITNSGPCDIAGAPKSPRMRPGATTGRGSHATTLRTSPPTTGGKHRIATAVRLNTTPTLRTPNPSVIS